VKVGIGRPAKSPTVSFDGVEISGHDPQRIDHQHVTVDRDQMRAVPESLVGHRNDLQAQGLPPCSIASI